jgi:glycosyltransferase involved in cell wall biosynthesis
VRDGENGFVVDPEDAACVAECIRAVIGDPAANDRMRCNSIALSKKMDPTIAARGIVDAAQHAVADREACCP